MKKGLLIALPLVGAVMFSGCATLFGGGGQQKISINSDSTKRLRAEVSYADGSSPQYLTIPGTITVDRSHKDIIIKSKNDTFEPKTVKKHVNGWFFANILGLGLGGATLLSSTTDAATGAMWKYDDAVTVHQTSNKK